MYIDTYSIKRYTNCQEVHAVERDKLSVKKCQLCKETH